MRQMNFCVVMVTQVRIDYHLDYYDMIVVYKILFVLKNLVFDSVIHLECIVFFSFLTWIRWSCFWVNLFVSLSVCFLPLFVHDSF